MAWAAFNQANIDAIHTVNLDALVFVTSPGYYSKKWVSDYYVANPLIGSNIVYAWQDYYLHTEGNDNLIEYYNKAYEQQDWTSAKAKMEWWFTRKAFKMTSAPTMLAEMGFSTTRPAPGPDPEWNQSWNAELYAIRDWYKVQRTYQQGWTQWVWWPMSSQDLGLLADDWVALTVTGELMAQNLAGKTPSHLLTVQSNPISGFPFTIEGV
ncbi:hypothetical protein ES703_80272 [subsurface metagenome]